MIILDYRTNNPRWGLTGVHFDSWDGYALTLGLLANIRHHRGYGTSLPTTIWSNSISIHIERNNDQGAWDKEGRIHYYKNMSDLQNDFIDLYNCHSAGNTATTCRINSNGYMYSLIKEYGFVTKTYSGLLTATILPPDKDIKPIIAMNLKNNKLPQDGINNALAQFDIGFNK